jgi:broad specificity phosphatase PhoE
MILYIVRHGETSHNKKGIFMGHYDAKLSSQGVKQARLLAERLKVVSFDYIYSSDLARAKRTTEEIAKFQKCPIQFSKQLRERKMGIFENQHRDKYYDFMDKNATKDRVRLPLPGGGESFFCQQKRAINFVGKIYKKHKGETILISTHGGIKRALLMYFKGISLEKFHEYIKFGNTSLSIVKFHKDNKYKVELENDIKHLL